MSEQYCAKHDFYYSHNHIIDVVCPWCEIDRLNKEISRLRQYEDAITSAVDGTLLVWNLMSTNHTVIKNDYWQNHLEDIDRIKAELEEASTRANDNYEVILKCNAQINDYKRQLAEARAEVERYKAGVEVVGHVCMQHNGASVPGLSAALLEYPHNVRVMIMKDANDGQQ